MRQKKKYELTGQTFGKLEVLGETEDDFGIRAWTCLCHGCGETVVMSTANLVRFGRTSCGCDRPEPVESPRKQKRGAGIAAAEKIKTPGCTLHPKSRSGECAEWKCPNCGWNAPVLEKRRTGHA